MKVSILGAGNMASAFASLINEEIMFYSIEEQVTNEINNFHTNSKYCDIKFNDNVTASNDLKLVLENSDIIVFSVPSFAVRSVCEKAKDFIPKNAIIIVLSKGLEKDSNLTMSEVIKEYFDNSIVSVAGPSIANEIMKKIPSYVIFASNSIDAMKYCKSVFENDYYNISLSNDLYGCEICSFLKNVYAIYFGFIDGLNYGLNTKSGILVKVLDEMSHLSTKLGVKKDTIYSLAGIGDLVVTGFSSHGRNRSFGELIAQGKNVDEAKKIVNQTIEGISALNIAKKIVDNKNINTNIIEKVYNVVFLNEKVSI